MDAINISVQRSSFIADIRAAKEPRVLSALDSIAQLLVLDLDIAASPDSDVADLKAICSLINLVRLEQSHSSNWSLHRELDQIAELAVSWLCLLYTSDAADDIALV